MLFYVFCELDFDKILLLQIASQPEPRSQTIWKMQQKQTHFPIHDDKLEPLCALQTTLLSAQQAGTLTTYPGDVAPRTTPCLWLLGQRHEAVKMLSLPGTAG